MASNPVRPSTRSHAPWRHTSELAMVRDWFYPSYSAADPYSAPPPDMRQTAVDHVHMWSFKDPKMPHAIIATANLTDAMLHDTWDRRRGISDWALRSIYAMAFCRFVNGFVDRDIAKAALRATAATKADAAVPGYADGDDEAGAPTLNPRGESSMYAHATAIGMPEQFVELRHRATHEEMPSLEVLRQMARQGLGWLWERWWKVHATDHPARALRERDERRLRAERKAETRRLNEADGRQSADTADRVGLVDESARAGHHAHMTDDVVGKRKRDVYDGDLDTNMPEDRHKAKSNGKLAKVKMKPWARPAFGLFEP